MPRQIGQIFKQNPEYVKVWNRTIISFRSELHQNYTVFIQANYLHFLCVYTNTYIHFKLYNTVKTILCNPQVCEVSFLHCCFYCLNRTTELPLNDYIMRTQWKELFLKWCVNKVSFCWHISFTYTHRPYTHTHTIIFMLEICFHIILMCIKWAQVSA